MPVCPKCLGGLSESDRLCPDCGTEIEMDYSPPVPGMTTESSSMDNTTSKMDDDIPVPSDSETAVSDEEQSTVAAETTVDDTTRLLGSNTLSSAKESNELGLVIDESSSISKPSEGGVNSEGHRLKGPKGEYIWNLRDKQGRLCAICHARKADWICLGRDFIRGRSCEKPICDHCSISWGSGQNSQITGLRKVCPTCQKRSICERFGFGLFFLVWFAIIAILFILVV